MVQLILGIATDSAVDDQNHVVDQGCNRQDAEEATEQCMQIGPPRGTVLFKQLVLKPPAP